MRSWVIFFMISFAVCATEPASVKTWERKVRAVQGQTPVEAQAAGDAATLFPYIRQIAGLAQDYYINGTLSDLDQVNQIVTTDMQSAIADLQSIAIEIPRTGVQMLFNTRARLKDPTIRMYVILLTQLSSMLGRLNTWGSGPTSLSPVDIQAKNEGISIQRLMIVGVSGMKGLGLAVQQYLTASNADKPSFLVDVQNVLTTIQGHVTTLSGLSVSVDFQSAIAALVASVPTDPTSSSFLAQVTDFAHNLNQFMGLFIQ